MEVFSFYWKSLCATNADIQLSDNESSYMKKAIFLSFLVFVFSCKKENEENLLKKEIVGIWELEKFVGYPFTQSTLTSGNGSVIVIGGDGLFERKKHDTLLFSGRYSVLRKKDCYERNNDMIFSTNESSSGDYRYIGIKDGKLSLGTPNCYQDGGVAYYRRLE